MKNTRNQNTAFYDAIDSISNKNIESISFKNLTREFENNFEGDGYSIEIINDTVYISSDIRITMFKEHIDNLVSFYDTEQSLEMVFVTPHNNNEIVITATF